MKIEIYNNIAYTDIKVDGKSVSGELSVKDLSLYIFLLKKALKEAIKVSDELLESIKEDED